MDSTFRPKKRKLPWKDTEKRIAKRLGGRRHSMSGAHFKQKGDSSTELLLIESKSTKKASISLKQAWLEKTNADALMQNKTPAVTITFENIEGRTERDWILLPLWFVQDLLKEAENGSSD